MTPEAPPPAQPARRSFVGHAKIISALTLLSRILGMLRESVAAKFFGAGIVSSAFTVAFTIPNLFRRLFGEGALSAAFIPTYSQALREQGEEEARRFAAASVNLLLFILLSITLIGEAVLGAVILWWPMGEDRLLAVKLTAIMLPYVLLVCGTAFLGAILQVHRRFGLVAAAPIILNFALIGSTLLGARLWNLDTEAGRTQCIYFVAASVVIAGVAQLLMLVPPLRAVGFRFRWTTIWTPTVKRMLKLSLPVAVGAGVIQISVLIDRGLSFLLADRIDASGTLLTHFGFMGWTIPFPMEHGAAARLAWAQYLYQFPLGVFAIALATAIFPTLSAHALDPDRRQFHDGLRQGITLALFEGLPASIGLILVAEPTVQVLFERGRFTPHDTQLMAGSVRLFAAGIWAFSLAQIINRAFYALHDTRTPLVLSIVTLGVDLGVKMAMIWSLGEAGMAAGTTISFTVQIVLMVWILQRKTGSLELSRLSGFAAKLLLATALMAGACLLVQQMPFFPPATRATAIKRLLILTGTGAVVYVGACAAMGMPIAKHLVPRRWRKTA